MDLQYAPRVLARPGHVIMERLIADAAKSERVGLFQRFELMRYWQDAPPADAVAMIGPDGLHMTDRGYGCLAAELAERAGRELAGATATRPAPRIPLRYPEPAAGLSPARRSRPSAQPVAGPDPATADATSTEGCDERTR